MTRALTTVVNNDAIVPERKVPDFLKVVAHPQGADVALMLDYTDEVLELALGSKQFGELTKEHKKRWVDNMELLAQATIEFAKDYKALVDAQRATEDK